MVWCRGEDFYQRWTGRHGEMQLLSASGGKMEVMAAGMQLQTIKQLGSRCSRDIRGGILNSPKVNKVRAARGNG